MNEIADLRGQIEDLKAEKRDLLAQLVPSELRDNFPSKWALTPTESAMLAFLVARAPATRTKEQILSAIYPNIDDAPELKIIDVFVCKLRKKIDRFGLKIETVWGYGYRISRQTADEIAAICAAHGARDGKSGARVLLRDGAVVVAGLIKTEAEYFEAIDALMRAGDALFGEASAGKAA